MGAQVNIVDSVHIFIAIAAHKGLAAYALGSSVVDSQACPHCAVACSSMLTSAVACLPWYWPLLLVSVPVRDVSVHRFWKFIQQDFITSLNACFAENAACITHCRLQAGMRKFWTVIGLFASATPVGIMLGVLLSTVANSDGAASVSALASGAAHKSVFKFWLRFRLPGKG